MTLAVGISERPTHQKLKNIYMARIDKKEQHCQDIKDLVHALYLLMTHGLVERVYTTLLSPNLCQRTLMEEYSEQYEQAFKFNRTILGHSVHTLYEIKPGLQEAIVLVSLLAEEAEPASKAEDDRRYGAYKIQCIFLDNEWYIDDISPYREFWSNEFKEILNKQNE